MDFTYKIMNVTFQLMTYEEFVPIRNSELMIYNQLIPLYTYIEDNRGDWVVDEHNEPIINEENPSGQIHLPSDTLSPELEGVDNRIDMDALNGYSDVFQIDNFKRHKPNSKLLVAFKSGKYQGCVWIWTNDKYIGMYGIRSSISNYILKIRGTASAILNEVIRIGNGRRVIVPNPLFSMVGLLRKYNFTEVCDSTSDIHTFVKLVDGNPWYWIL